MKARAVAVTMSASLSALASSAAMAAPAPALTAVQIYRIDSPDKYENVNAGQSSTVNTYDQTPLYVTVQEIGTGKAKITKFDGQQVNLQATMTSICGSSTAPRACNSGETAIGSRSKYNLGQLGGGRTFYFQDTSATSPYNTYSTQIIIK